MRGIIIHWRKNLESASAVLILLVQSKFSHGMAQNRRGWNITLHLCLKKSQPCLEHLFPHSGCFLQDAIDTANPVLPRLFMTILY